MSFETITMYREKSIYEFRIYAPAADIFINKFKL